MPILLKNDPRYKGKPVTIPDPDDPENGAPSTIWITSWSKEFQAYYEEVIDKTASLAEAQGLTISEDIDRKQLGQMLLALPKEERDKLMQMNREIDQRPLRECITAWDLTDPKGAPIPVTPENIDLLPNDVKAILRDEITELSTLTGKEKRFLAK